MKFGSIRLMFCAWLAGGYSFSGSVASAETPAADSVPKYDATDIYRRVALDGWQLIVHPRLIDEQPELYAKCLKVFEHQLNEIVRRVPTGPVAKMQQVPIWLELFEPHHPCAAYHPDAGWLQRNEMNPEKAKCVEISNANNFVTWTIAQPFMLLHELAHAYHDQFLEGGHGNREVIAAYEQAKQSGKYDKVLKYNSVVDRHYGLNTPMEYFAEATEAFFGTNDFYPFVAPELRAHDPAMFALLEKLWEAPRPIAGNGKRQPKVVMLVSEDEYKTEQTLPEFSKSHLQGLFQVEFVLGAGDDPSRLEKLELLKNADVAVISMRRRVLPADQLQTIRGFLEAGKPVVAIRTASHAFAQRDNIVAEGRAAWPTFDTEVLGASYQGHRGRAADGGPSSLISVEKKSADHPILRGIAPAEWPSQGTLYNSRDLRADAQVLMTGRTADGDPEPVAWTTSSPWGGKVFYTSLGHPEDFKTEQFTTLLRNALLWATEQPIEVAPSNSPASGLSQPESAIKYQPGQAPQEAVSKFTVPDDLEIELVLSEPEIAQPLHISFDERGRMWLVEYRQYPHPAGLKVVSRDNWWRAVYDKMPPAPPHHDRGIDRISIHEDTNGDGQFDSHKVFLDDLNIATAVAVGRGGAWVLHPPYLLFYPDANRDDVPDGDPVLHLSGFGIEDTHSCANSLRFGPDGWLYGAQGSTVTCDVRRVGLDATDKPGVQYQGQMIWRYHPQSRRFEIFSEGGGNAFGLDIDRKGRIFSGHNGGDTRGFHYMQGAYLQKGFGKHGPLSNPFAFGYFPAMNHDKVNRFTHEFTIYDGGALPEAYHGKMFGVAPLLQYVSISDVTPNGSTFATKDTGFITSSDKWFCPVDIAVGPDGALYVADWYDGQCAHTRNAVGEMENQMGRVFRIKAKGAKPVKIDDLAKLPTAELAKQLNDTNIWRRQTALRLLGDRRDQAAIEPLRAAVANSTDQLALESLWALYQSGGLDEATALKCLDHADPFVRLWTARLLGDERQVPAAIATKLAELAGSETEIEVLAQFACSARRLPVEQALPIVRQLSLRESNSHDPRLPLLLWWAIEQHCASHPQSVIQLCADADFASTRMAQAHLLSLMMRRYASTGKRADLLTCAEMLQAAAQVAIPSLMRGFEQAYRGGSGQSLPAELVQALSKAGAASLALRVRLAQPPAIDEALTKLVQPETKAEECEELIAVLAEVREPRAVGPLLQLALAETLSAEANAKDKSRVASAALAALGNFSDDVIAQKLVAACETLSPELQPLAHNLLAGRGEWSLALLSAIEAEQIDGDSIPLPIVKKLLLHNHGEINQRVNRIWGDSLAQSAATILAERTRLESVLANGHGDPYDGKKLFLQQCGKCHTMFSEGGQVGPDLTSYSRQNVGNMLMHVVDPNAEIREGFETYAVLTADGQALSGFLADQDAQTIVLRGFNGESTTVARDDIESMRATGQSLMPDGLLKELTEDQVRNLFAYLRSTQPLNN